MLCRGGVTVPVSFDQKPTDPRELARIVEAGGFVTDDGRLGGSIGVARAIGDIDLKPANGGGHANATGKNVVCCRCRVIVLYLCMLVIS